MKNLIYLSRVISISLIVFAHNNLMSTPLIWSGTGFALANNYIVTNYHVVNGAECIMIQGINGYFNTKYEAEVVATDKKNDLALLKVNGVSISSMDIPYTINTTTSDVGEDIFVLGYPLTSTMGEEIKLTTGVVSSKTGYKGDVSIYQISAPIQPGNSGGPLFDSKGNIIGIVSAKHGGAENVGYAIKTLYLKNLIECSIASNIFPQVNTIEKLNLSSKVKAVKNYVYYITCSKSTTSTLPYRENNVNKKDLKVTGYRVQVFKGGNTKKDQETAEQIRKELKYLFPYEYVYVNYFSPNWICRIGDYVTYEEALKMKEKIDKIGFPNTLIMKGTIKVR